MQVTWQYIVYSLQLLFLCTFFILCTEASNTAVKNDPVYEEIELKGSPNLTNVNQIAMQANSAYEGVEMRPPTKRNANQMEPCPAYGVTTGQH